uniref:Uncharacterized protein n=1 Tax=Salix viminalis TaxID=40686 RepID=A0A6N2NLJ2_SALVM
MEAQRKPQFPPQTQPQQPGKEYVMCPLPQAINPDYKPSEKLNGKVALGDWRGFGHRKICVLPFCIRGCNCGLYICTRHRGQRQG